MADEPLDHWIDGLTGNRPPRGGKDEAAAIRQLVLAESGQSTVRMTVEPVPPARFTPGQGRFSGQVSGLRKIPTWAWPSGVGLAAALLLGVALLQYQPTAKHYPFEPVLRGDPADVKTLLDDQPRSRAEFLYARLRSVGAQVSIYQHGDIYTLDVVVVPENAQAITQALKDQGIDDAPYRSVRVQIQPR